jgi:lipopolysaccharide/colanic/teichoic acid biosynthesis glycosyltransferase
MARNKINNSKTQRGSHRLARTDEHNGGRTLTKKRRADQDIAEAEGLRLVDLMGFSADSAAQVGVSSKIYASSVDIEPALAPADCSVPDWTGLASLGIYSQVLRPAIHMLLLMVALPVTLCICVPIVLANLITFRDPRLVFYSQDRMGQFGRTFRIYKFRTMRPAHGSSFESWSQGDQNRVTALGRFLRSTHLDELPQIYNIVLGDMDFIGPRPEMVEIHKWATQAVHGFERRLVLRPGITGLAQITQGYAGQCPEAYAAKLRADDIYRQNQSAHLDVSILLRTVTWMLRGKGWNWDKKK